MARRKRSAPQRGGRQRANGAGGDEQDIYQEMLAEAGVAAAPAGSSPERPFKRRTREGVRVPSRRRPTETARVPLVEEASTTGPGRQGDGDEEEEDAEFEDVAIPEPTVQTVELRSDEEEEGDEDDEDEDLHFEDVDLTIRFPDGETDLREPKELELNLSAQKSAMLTSKQVAERRKPITKEEKGRRLDVHKTHLLCLMSHVAKRNHWCNDRKVQGYLRSHLTDKMIRYLTPGTNLSQFGRTESLKNGLKLVADVWTTTYEITERGLRRSLWAEEVDHLDSYEPPSDMESCLDKSDFREAAKTLQGSRDVGAQLYCALLRSAGVRARLVCSLQPLPFGSAGPMLPKPKENAQAKSLSKTEQVLSQVARYREMASAASPASSAGPRTARRRLGHPNASDYNFEPTAAPGRPRVAFDAPKRIRESSYPVYWVEILDVGHQKWQPTDPVVTHSLWKPKALEPPITDKENCLCYVVAFDADGSAKDVTRRYAKAYAAKTRKLRIEAASDDGRQWWRRVMKTYKPKTRSDLDQIEDIELAGVEAREPMPRNVQDFKGHPVYALERHLGRHEVLIPGAVPSGTVAAGARAPLERIFRRKDVRVARSAEKWFRLGREVKPGEIPAKWLPRRVQNKRSRFGEVEEEQGEDADGDAGTPIYTTDQTELYEPPPVRNGRVPKNKFGNIEVYVPSMIPKGGVHIVDEYARRAAHLLGIDCAPALTGFQFQGRQGTAVLNGIVVAEEFEEAVRAAIQGMLDLEQEMEDEKRRYVALKLWRRFLMGLRIRERIWSGVGEEERRRADKEAQLEAETRDVESDETEEFEMVVDDDDDDDDGGGGGFLVE
ncbi:hypothetical protein Trco_005050 [Trichoderma cornu-damae]|uniref:Rad4-domain-containing protein n=1 Tax=Trichoderma cornu-damae TaxID=654480 RepID=A0A9P8QNS9_9HYPO|nr:hypothetical protein Trco_005050 [Trichoderma cornu-damae]